MRDNLELDQYSPRAHGVKYLEGRQRTGQFCFLDTMIGEVVFGGRDRVEGGPTPGLQSEGNEAGLPREYNG